MNGRVLSAVLLISVGLALGCESNLDTGRSTSPQSGVGSSDTTRGTIGVSLMTLTNPFFEVIGKTIEEEAAQRDYETVYLGADEDAAKQTDQVKDFIVQEVAAIVLAPYDSQAIGAVIAEANAAGIPVFTIDNACLASDCDIVCHVATDNVMGGRQAVDAMIEALDGVGGKIAILDHKMTQSCLNRVTGFKEVLGRHNEAAEDKIEIVAELACGGNREDGHDTAQDIIQSHPGIVGIFAINDPSALGAHMALMEANKQDQVVLIGFDGQPEGKKAIRDGMIYADPIQFPVRMARKTVEVMMRHFDGEVIEPEVLIATELYHQADAEKDANIDGYD